jgi:polyribonucleotide nucleotidyltransferase
MIPTKDEFPYTIRVVAETLSSNGSSSMASTCAASLSLMDAGVPLKKHVAGIAMGLMLGEKGEYKVLTDIQGPEDHHGDMDCKVAGTRDGITAIQMDVKVEGITKEIFRDTLENAKRARLHILEVMEKTLQNPRENVSSFAPTIQILTIPKEKIGLVIGGGGKTINGLIAMAGGQVAIDIEEDGKIYVSGLDQKLVTQTIKSIEGLVREYRSGEIVEGTVIKLLDFGAIVDLGGGQDGMIHISELKDGFVKKVDEVVKLGDKVRVKVLRAEEGKIALSLKAMEQK